MAATGTPQCSSTSATWRRAERRCGARAHAAAAAGPGSECVHAVAVRTVWARAAAAGAAACSSHARTCCLALLRLRLRRQTFPYIPAPGGENKGFSECAKHHLAVKPRKGDGEAQNRCDRTARSPLPVLLHAVLVLGCHVASVPAAAWRLTSDTCPPCCCCQRCCFTRSAHTAASRRSPCTPRALSSRCAAAGESMRAPPAAASLACMHDANMPTSAPYSLLL